MTFKKLLDWKWELKRPLVAGAAIVVPDMDMDNCSSSSSSCWTRRMASCKSLK
jgi:hypothetical protein